MKRTKAPKNKQNLKYTILSNDPSLTAWGWSVITPDGKVLEAGCIETDPAGKKIKIRKGDDNIRRADELLSVLHDQLIQYNVKFIISELPHGSQNSQGATMIGICIGILQTISKLQDIPIDWYSEAEAKQEVFGKEKCSKAEMVREMRKRYLFPEFSSDKKTSGVADSIAIFNVARKKSQMIKFLQNEQ